MPQIVSPAEMKPGDVIQAETFKCIKIPVFLEVVQVIKKLSTGEFYYEVNQIKQSELVTKGILNE